MGPFYWHVITQMQFEKEFSSSAIRRSFCATCTSTENLPLSVDKFSVYWQASDASVAELGVSVLLCS